MKTSRSIYIALIIFCFISGTAFAQFFGKNKVQYTDFDWYYLQSEHFDVYFSEGGESIASFVAKVAEESYLELSKDFRYQLAARLTIIVYNSHNDFAQTNVDLSPSEESVGGFTEFLKNRVVIPYEGEWEKFRHVIHHEVTHAVMLQMVYGAGAQSIITGMAQLQLPLWLVEGLAEYESRGWDIESDMFMRDATLNGYVPPVNYLYGYMSYKGGQSVLKFIADRYGREKIGELLGKIKINKSVEKGLKQSIGIDTEELTERWHLELKRLYWPDIEDRQEPSEFAKQLTDHEKYKNFINTNPTVSNRGDKIAFISDKDDYFDVYLKSAIDGRMLKKLVRGQRAGNLEELHWLKGPSISFSPDDEQLVFTAKAGEEDALNFVDVREGEITKTITLQLDGIHNPAWSPSGNEIAFMGIKNGQSDIYCYDLENEKLKKITDDIFSNVEPKWSPDGKKLVFASDRGKYIDHVPQHLKPNHIDMKNYDIYEIQADGSGLKRLVSSKYSDTTPSYAPEGDKIVFVSERSGISNIYLKDLQSGKEWPITNVLTGIFQPSWGGNANRLAFVSFYKGGYDIFQLKNPLDIDPGEIKVEKTQFVKSFENKHEEKTAEEQREEEPLPSAADASTKKYRDFIFDNDFAKGEVKVEETDNVFLDSSDYVLPSGKFKVKDYKVKFTLDFVYGAFGYDQFFGTQGYTNIMLSDVLGNHRLNLGLNMFGDLKNANYSATYFYLPKRLDVGAGIYHHAYYFYSNTFGWVRDRNYGLSLYLSNPFNRYKRLSYSMSLMGVSRNYLDQYDEIIDLLIDDDFLPPRDRFFMLNNVTYTKDNTIWGSTGPSNGTRYALGVTYSPQLGEHGIDFTTIRADWRRYLRLTNNYSFALRASGGVSLGKHPQKFFLGGVSNWLNRDYYGGIRVDNIEEIYFATFEMPLRGADYYQLEGTRFLMTNLEFRFPLIKRLSMGFPLPLEFWNIGGAIFSDMGLAWNKGDQVKPFVRGPNDIIQTRDVFMSYGFGARIFLGFFLLRVDFAWPTDLYQSGDMHVIWSLGADF